MTASQQTLTSPEAKGQVGDLATFDFLATPTTSYLLMHQGASGPQGDIRRKTVSATFSIEKAAGVTFYFDLTDNPCSTPASTRFFFQTSNSDGFSYTHHYWWSNPKSAILDAVQGTVTISAVVEGARWSDYNGQSGSDPAAAAGFDAAAADVTYLGLSFGGGCFFANGVGVRGGMATFHLWPSQCSSRR